MRAALPIITAAGLALSACGCAAGVSSPAREVSAVVQDEGARQAAVEAARQGEGSKAALEAGAQAAQRDKDVSEPPT
jgi:hypothetical protein